MKNNKTLIFPISLFLFWIILCERFDAETVMIGLLMTGFVYYLNRNFVMFKRVSIKKLPYYILYLLLLMKEIFVANINVAMIVLSPTMKVSPCVIKYKTQLEGSFHKTILANSITLTPGTITVELEGDELVVHCLMKDYIRDLLDSKFEKLLLKIEE